MLKSTAMEMFGKTKIINDAMGFCPSCFMLTGFIGPTRLEIPQNLFPFNLWNTEWKTFHSTKEKFSSTQLLSRCVYKFLINLKKVETLWLYLLKTCFEYRIIIIIIIIMCHIYLKIIANNFVTVDSVQELLTSVNFFHVLSLFIPHYLFVQSKF